MKNKGYLSIENIITKFEKIMERSFDKVSVSSCMSKNGVILGWSGLRFLAIRVVEIEAILSQSDAFETKYIEFLYSAIFSLFFSNKEIF